MNMQHISVAKRATGMPAKLAEAKGGFATEKIGHVKATMDGEICTTTGTGDAAQAQHAARPHVQALPEGNGIAIEIGFHGRAGDGDGGVKIKFQCRPAQRDFETGSGGGVAHQFVGDAKGIIIHRTRRRNAHGPITDASGIILDAALRARLDDINRRRLIRKRGQPFGVNIARRKFPAGDHLPEIIEIAFDARQPRFGQRGLQFGDGFERVLQP